MEQNRLYIGRHNWRHLGHNQDTRLTLTELIMTGKQEGPYMGEETKAEEDKGRGRQSLTQLDYPRNHKEIP